MGRFLCTGDSHIGAGRDLAPDRLAEQEQVWRSILALARDEGVDTVLHGGDMWERRKPTPDEYLAAERPLVEHKAAGGPPVLVVAGNHDRAGVDDNLALAVLAQAGLIQLSTEPETVRLGGVAVCTLPWTPVSRLVAAQDGGDRDMVYADAAELLIQTARGLRDQVDGPAILMLHWSISGASLPSGLPVEMAREVILPLAGLEQLGFDAIVAAHIHRGQLLCEEPLIAYVGSPLPLTFGEADQEHGVSLLDSANWRAEFRPLESRRFVTLTPDDYDDGLPVPPREAWTSTDDWDVAGAFVKVKGPATVDVAYMRERLAAAGASRAWFELTAERVVRDRGAAVSGEMSPVDALAGYLAAAGHNRTLDALVERGKAYLEAVGS